MFLRARAADSHCEIIRFPVRFFASSALCSKMKFQILQGFLARDLQPVRPPNEGWLMGFGETRCNRGRVISLSLRDRRFTAAGSSRKSIADLTETGLAALPSAVLVKDGQPIADHPE